MRKGVVALAGSMWVLSVGSSVPLAAGQQPAAGPAGGADHGAVVTKYCVTCHNDRAKTGGSDAREDRHRRTSGADADVWERSSARCASG